MSKMKIEINFVSLSAEIVSADLANTVYAVAFDDNAVPSLVRKGKGTHGIFLKENPCVRVVEVDTAAPDFVAKVNAEVSAKFERINGFGIGYPQGFAEAHKLYSDSVKKRDVALVKIKAKAKTLTGSALIKFNEVAEEFKATLVVHHIPDELKAWQPEDVQLFKDSVINRLANEMVKSEVEKPINVDKLVQTTVNRLAETQLHRIAKLRGEEERAKRDAINNDIENFFADLAK